MFLLDMPDAWPHPLKKLWGERMRVSIKYDEQSAGFAISRTTIYQAITVEFSDEEKQTIRQRSMLEYEIADFDITGLASPNIKFSTLAQNLPLIGGFFGRRSFDLTVRELLRHKTFIYRFDDAGYAKSREQQVRAGLARLKEALNVNKEVGRNEVYDL